MPKNKLLAIFAPLEIAQQDLNDVLQKAVCKKFLPKTLINQGEGCLGFMLVLRGNIRAYIIGENAKEITLFSLKADECCVVCSHCALHSINYHILLESSENTEVLIVPERVFVALKDKYPQLANFTLELLAKRLNQTITTFEQLMFKPLVSRIREFLHANQHNNEVMMSHENIANHLGSAREAVSRILKKWKNKVKSSFRARRLYWCKKRDKIYIIPSLSLAMTQRAPSQKLKAMLKVAVH